MKRPNLLIVLSLGGVTSLLLASSAHAFRIYGAVWPGSTADYRISTTSFPPGSPQLRAAEEAFEDWNRVPNSEFLFTYASASNSGALNHSDNLNGVAFSSQVQGSTLGVTFSSDWGGQRRSADVLFNSSTRWDFTGNPSFNEWDLGSTARHEYGHALGLEHSNLGCRALMGAGCGLNGSVRQIDTDDAAGARHLYPGPSRHTGGGGGGGTTGSVDWQVTALTTSTNRVRPGDSLDATYTVTNGGTGSGATAPQRYYLLSTNSTISTQDTLLLDAPERQGPFAPGANFQGTSPVTIPSTTAPGTYWIGILVDPLGVATELNEDNNTRAVQLVIEPTGGGGGGGQVDWTVQSARLSATQVAPGDTLTVTWETANAGAATASAVPPVGVYLSTNSTISTQDTEVTTQPQVAGTFAAGTAQPGTHTFQVNLQPGTYYVGLFVDPRGQTAEALEDNNTQAVLLEVTGSGGGTSTGGGGTGGGATGGGSTAGGTTAGGTTAPGSTAGAANTPRASKGSGKSACTLVAGAEAGWPATLLLFSLLVFLVLFRKEGANPVSPA